MPVDESAIVVAGTKSIPEGDEGFVFIIPETAWQNLLNGEVQLFQLAGRDARLRIMITAAKTRAAAIEWLTREAAREGSIH